MLFHNHNEKLENTTTNQKQKTQRDIRKHNNNSQNTRTNNKTQQQIVKNKGK